MSTPDPHWESSNILDTEDLPFGKVIGVTDSGVPVFSNGDRRFFSQDISFAPARRRAEVEPSTVAIGPYDTLGYKWLALEFVRRYLVMTKGVWLASVPTAEDIWSAHDIFSIIQNCGASTPVPVKCEEYGITKLMPSVGDLLVWSRTEGYPYGHVAVVTHVSDSWIRIAEQNHEFKRWPPGQNYSRQLDCKRKEAGTTTITRSTTKFDNDNCLLGWITIQVHPYDFTSGDLPDKYRHILGPGHILRHRMEREVSLPWLNTSDRCDFILKRSLVIDGSSGEDGVARESDAPDGYYVMDYDAWCRFRYAANTLHEVAMEATRCILNDCDSENLLVHYFGVPVELHPQLRRSFETIPPMCGRFDFGFDGKNITMLEYNCDSSAAMLECGDTQDKMARYYGVDAGNSTGSFLYCRIVNYFKCLLQNKFVCPSHKLIHFMVDDNDEERYTALYAMNAAEAVGFRTKLCVKLSDFRFASSSSEAECMSSPTERRSIVDLENEEVLLVWKTWAWDTVLHQYIEQRTEEGPGMSTKPSLSDIILNEKIRVLEPLWKAVTGSKAVLPFMYAAAPHHPNMVPASFQRAKEIISAPYLSKPVNGRAGQNIIMYDKEKDNEAILSAPLIMSSPVLVKSSSTVLFDVTPADASEASYDATNENSTGRFIDSAVVYQSRVFLTRYENKYFPIFCGWNVGGEFGGIVVREDTSKITKLSSIVAPARVVRENIPLYATQKIATSGEM